MMRSAYLQLVVPALVMVMQSTGAWTQPVLSSKMQMHGFDIYQDHEIKQLYYYSPADLALTRKSDGSPDFILIGMRYTGTHFSGDENYKGFLNILQLAVTLEQIPTSVYQEIMTSLGRNVQLRPLPIRRFEGELIIPLGDAAAANEKYRKVSVHGFEGDAGQPGNTFWQQRTFTLQLDNAEAQLLWNQVNDGQLAISFSYAFYAEAMPGVKAMVDASGTRSDITESMEDVPEDLLFDAQVNTYLVKANTFPIQIDVTKYPECLKRVDINEELPPAYAAFDIRCYDFADDLRPDLFKKIVEIKAFAAAKEFISVKADFNANKPDVSALRVRFPYAIRLDQPMEYRIIEISKDGASEISQWMPLSNWSEVIDVTTPFHENPIGKKSLDVEVDLVQLQSAGVTHVECEVRYALRDKSVVQKISWTADDAQPMKTLHFQYDLDSPVEYALRGEKDVLQKPVWQRLQPTDTYVFLRVPDGN
jgi:hypothetical protein